MSHVFQTVSHDFIPVRTSSFLDTMGLLGLSPKYFNITSNFVIFIISTWVSFGDFQVTPIEVLCLTSLGVAHLAVEILCLTSSGGAHPYWECPSALHLRHRRKRNPGSLLEVPLCAGLRLPSSPHLHGSLWPTLPCHYFSLSLLHFYSPVFETTTCQLYTIKGHSWKVWVTPFTS